MGEFVSFPDFTLGEPGEFITIGNLVYVDGDDTTVIVPSGFSTDFASIPKAIPRRLFDPMVHGRRAAVVHDFLCRKANASQSYDQRVYADRLFRQILVETGTSRIRAYVMWAAVRANTWRLKLKGDLS